MVGVGEPPAFPLACVEVQDPSCLDLEVGVPGKIHERCLQGWMASSDSHR